MVFEVLEAAERSWAARTYAEVNEVAGRDGSVAVVPVAAVEQHGHHLPTGTDTIQAVALAHAGCERLPDDVPALFTPPIWTGQSGMHREFGGGISLSVRTILSLLEDVGRSAVDTGFDAVVFLNGHGGNVCVGDVIASLSQERPDREFLGVPLAPLAERAATELRESDPGGMYHAGEYETSLMYHVAPDLVREDAVEGERYEEPYDRRTNDIYGGGLLSVYRWFDRFTESGVAGDAHLATAEKGAAFYDCVAEELAVLLEAVHEENRA